MNVKRIAWLLLVTGCAVGPKYRQPSAPVPRAAAYREGWKLASLRMPCFAASGGACSVSPSSTRSRSA